MARKDLLKSLMQEATSEAPAPTPATPETRVDPARPRYAGGAIGAVSQSIADLKSRSMIEIDPFAITGGGLRDRLDDDDADHFALVKSLREYGQQVPVLVRPHPEEADKFQIVYGRRRVRALRDLGIPVKALVRTLNDRELIVAQGQENSARKDLSFIEKASFAGQMRDLGYKRKVICDALSLDKTVMSRMLAVVDAIDPDLIQAIGAAPSVGRDRWLKLAELLEEREVDTVSAIGYANALAGGPGSDDRFEGLMTALTVSDKPASPTKTAPRTSPDTLHDAEGAPLGHVKRTAKATTLTLPRADADDGFDTWLVDNLTEIHRDWKAKRGE